MYYTNLILQGTEMENAFRVTINKRWDFVTLTTSGGTKAIRIEPNGEWEQLTRSDYNSQASREQWEEYIATQPLECPPSHYYEAIRSWDSEAIARDWVAAVQALNVPNCSAAYLGTTDPSAV
jgi:hypothetical protein